MAAPESSELMIWDYLAIVIYLLLNLAVGAYALCRPNRDTISGFFLAGRFMWWLPVGASLFASNIGSEHFIGLAGSGAAAGIGVGAFNNNSILLLQLMSWIFLPVFISSGVCTVPEYMSKRFGGQRIQTYLAMLSLALYVFTKISVDLYSGSLFINQAIHWNIYASMAVLLLLTGLFTTTGGLAAVIYTDTLQCLIFVIGAIVVMIKAFQEVDGYEALQYKYMQAVPKLTYENTTCGVPRADSWIMLRDPVNSDLPWPAFLLGQTPSSIWYWCADQMMVQRALAAKSLSHAKGATIFTAYLKILPFFMIILPGMISRALYPNDVACVLPEECLRACGSTSSCFNSAYPRLVVGIMPAGLKGFMLAVMLAALVSDLTSIFNSASTMFTLDLWPRLRPKAKTRELLIVSKVFIVVLVAVSIGWVPIIEAIQGGQLFIYIQKIGAYLSPPIAGVYTLAILWPRMNEKGAFWALMGGLFVGVIRMILDFFYPPPACWQEEYRPLIIRMNFMYFAAVLFWLTVLIAVIVSLLSNPLEAYRLIRTTFWSRFDVTEREDEKNLEETQTSDIPLDSVTQNFTPGENSSEAKIENEKFTCLERLRMSFCWLCGLETRLKATPAKSDKEEQQLRLTSLEETTRAKFILRINLVMLFAVAVGLFSYFSVDPFPEGFDPRTYVPEASG